MVKADQILQLEKTHTALVSHTTAILVAMRRLRPKISSLRKSVGAIKYGVSNDIDSKEDAAWLAEFDEDCKAAWELCSKAHKAILADKTSPIATEILAVILAAKGVVQANHACDLGRSGCEMQWDKAIKDLTKAVEQVRV